MSSNLGPQKSPASEARIKAQQRQLQLQKQIENADPADKYCIHCGYSLIKTGKIVYCSYCFTPVGE